MRFVLASAAALVLGVAAPAFADFFDNWAYELSPEARQIYAEKRVQVSCAEIDRLLKAGDTVRVYVAIRDAGLFGDRSCARHIERHAKALTGWNAVAFYHLKAGDGSQLRVLAQSYDNFGAKVGDHDTWISSDSSTTGT